MRDVKFRVHWQDFNEERMIEWDELKEEELLSTFLEGGFPESSKPMQFTGLKDKNGIEIYEGDIVKRVYGSGAVFIGEVTFEDATYFIKNTDEYVFLDNQYKQEEVEILGNIHENHDLLFFLQE